MTLRERLQVLLAHGPIDPRATVELPGAVHGQASRFVRNDQPFDRIHIGLAIAVVVWVAFEDRLDVRLVAFQDKGASANGVFWFLQVAELLYHFWGDNPHTLR